MEKTNEMKISKTRQSIDSELEMLIHRLVYNGITTYDAAISQLASHQCVEFRQSHLLAATALSEKQPTLADKK